jgi:hypothetical protein
VGCWTVSGAGWVYAMLVGKRDHVWALVFLPRWPRDDFAAPIPLSYRYGIAATAIIVRPSTFEMAFCSEPHLACRDGYEEEVRD